MTSVLEEIKIRARVRLNHARRDNAADTLTLTECLHDAARALGFAHWEHVRRIMDGHAMVGDDLGDFWHVPRSGIVPNQWFASHAEALQVLDADRSAYLLPYRRQCFIVRAPFIQALGVDPEDVHWSALRHDLLAGYGSSAWDALANQRMRAPLHTFAARSAARPA